MLLIVFSLIFFPFLLGSLHKWTFTPRGCGLLWVKREYHGMVRPPITSRDKGKSLSDQVCHQGCRDHIPFLCTRHSLQFYKAIGGMVRESCFDWLPYNLIKWFWRCGVLVFSDFHSFSLFTVKKKKKQNKNKQKKPLNCYDYQTRRRKQREIIFFEGA